MDILVPMKFVPDPVEEMEIDEDTGLLDRTFMRLIPSELDEHALEQAILLKEKFGGSVTVLAFDCGDVEDTLYTAVAKGADRVIKIGGEGFEEGVSNHAGVEALLPLVQEITFDWILIGTQALDDLDGSLGALLAARLGIPYVGYITGVEPDGAKLKVRKEFPGGLLAELELQKPAVLGIQAADQAPRYVVTNLVMEAMRSATLEDRESEIAPTHGIAEIRRMSVPEAGARAEWLQGDAEEVAAGLVHLLQEKGLVAQH
ncbi:MAG: electron transfer flavoprotein subunit beta [Planctomycetota bacterium]|nr:MAG: electron transfer flavoprotein subunit beta [Planctomycetota bacterium]